MFPINFLKNIGKFLTKTFKLIKKIVPDDQFAKAIDIATEAGKKFVDNAERREWAVKELMHFFPMISESVARFIVELAVQHIKSDAIDKAADKAKDAVSN
jgi:hypothetical protein